MPIHLPLTSERSPFSKDASARLHKALLAGELEAARQALADGADPASPQKPGLHCPLGIAARRNWVGALELLKQAGAPFPSDDELWRAAARGGDRALRWVAAQPDALPSLGLGPAGRQDPLSIASGLARARSARWLLDLGAPCSREDERGRQALHYASYGGRMPVMSLLLDAGADPNASDSEGARPAHSAAYTNSVEALRLLRRSGADLTAKNAFNEDPICWAIAGGAEEAALFLAARGADLAAVSSRQRLDPIAMAKERQLLDLASKLEAELARRERNELAHSAPLASACVRRKPRV